MRDAIQKKFLVFNSNTDALIQFERFWPKGFNEANFLRIQLGNQAIVGDLFEPKTGLMIISNSDGFIKLGTGLRSREDSSRVQPEC